MLSSSVQSSAVLPAASAPGFLVDEYSTYGWVVKVGAVM
jgi:hypothetical protein